MLIICEIGVIWGEKFLAHPLSETYFFCWLFKFAGGGLP